MTERITDPASDSSVEISNADVSGIGVVIGFVGTTVLATLLLLFNYLVAYDPLIDDLSSSGNSQEPQPGLKVADATSNPNPVDVGCVGFFRRLFRIGGKWRLTTSAFEQCIVDICDLQLFSGLAILISGFLSLRLQAEPISTLDWQTIVSLAWFSAITHLAGLTTLRSYFRSRAQHRTIRVVLMLMLLLLLIIALIPTGLIDWENPKNHYRLASSPVIDYFDISVGLARWDARCVSDGNCRPILMDKTMQATIVSALLLVIGFVGRVIRLYPTLSSAVTHYTQRPLARLSRRLLNKAVDLALFKFDEFICRLWIDLVIVPLVGLHLCLRWTTEIYSSMLFEILWLLVVFLWGLMRLLSMRAIQDKVLEEHEGLDPNPWSFGQTVAVALLASPLFSLVCKLSVSGMVETPGYCSGCNRDRHIAAETATQGTSAGRRGDSVELDSLIEGDTEDGSPSEISLEHGLSKQPYPEEIRFLRELISNRASTSFPWLAICRAVSCFPSVAILCIANYATNYRIEADRLSDGPVPPAQSISEFWITTSGVLGYVLLLYPCVGATMAVIGLRLDWIFRSRNMQTESKAGISFLFSVLSISLQICTCWSSPESLCYDI